MGLILFIAVNYFDLKNQEFTRDYYNYVLDRQKAEEQYTIEMAPLINQCVYAIAEKDTACSDVLLLTYHNTKKTLQGFSYVYLDYLTEIINKPEQRSLKNEWKDLEYIYYEDELSKIHNNSYLQITNIDDILQGFPKLYERIVNCRVKSAAFYPIEGTAGTLGMIIIFYNEPKTWPTNYYKTTISQSAQKLSSILDYYNIERYLNNVK